MQKTKLFLDSGDPDDTRCIKALSESLVGQTTNPSLVAHNPDVVAYMKEHGRLSKEKLHEYYKNIVEEIAEVIPSGDISIEVYANLQTSADDMLIQAREMNTWIKNGRIKFPANAQGIEAAAQAVQEGIRVNMTLIFSQQQAAAIHVATKGSQTGQVVVSPFIGRLEDHRQNGIDLVRNIVKMYDQAQSPVGVLAASLRSIEHIKACLSIGADIVTVPVRLLEEWIQLNMVASAMPVDGYDYLFDGAAIPYEELDLDTVSDWHAFDLSHPLLTEGIEKFAQDWDHLLG